MLALFIYRKVFFGRNWQFLTFDYFKSRRLADFIAIFLIGLSAIKTDVYES